MSSKLKHMLGYTEQLREGMQKPMNEALASAMVADFKSPAEQLSKCRFATETRPALNKSSVCLYWPDSAAAYPPRPATIYDLSAGRTIMYVYTDVIENTVVGDSFVPLLRTVPLPEMYGTDTSYVYSPRQLQWHRLNTNRLEVIRIYITNSNGEPMPFERGALSVTVRIRRVGELE